MTKSIDWDAPLFSVQTAVITTTDSNRSCHIIPFTADMERITKRNKPQTSPNPQMTPFFKRWGWLPLLSVLPSRSPGNFGYFRWMQVAQAAPPRKLLRLQWKKHGHKHLQSGGFLGDKDRNFCHICFHHCSSDLWYTVMILLSYWYI